MKTFDLTGATKMSFSHSSTEEFEELNQSLNKMTEKIYSDYDRLKQFTENASHEIQTPLSIILNKIEMLIQSENFSEEQMAHLQKINEAAVRLSRLNTALLTLTKIENRQYAHEGEFDLPCFIQRKIDEFQDFICQKNLQVSIHGDNGVCISMNPSLADLLFENLIRNAIKHNIDGGFIKILIEKNKFTISNSGRPLQLAADELFERFVKNDQSSDSLGLGLAMVKQICNNYGFAISFTSTGDLHNISICF
jgi:signal transduction histidine kinase